MTIPDIVGLLGVCGYIAAYALLQLRKVNGTNPLYLLLNGSGSALILFSLYFSFNLPSFISQSSWLILTLFGAFRVWRAGGRTTTDTVRA